MCKLCGLQHISGYKELCPWGVEKFPWVRLCGSVKIPKFIDPLEEKMYNIALGFNHGLLANYLKLHKAYGGGPGGYYENWNTWSDAKRLFARKLLREYEYMSDLWRLRESVDEHALYAHYKESLLGNCSVCMNEHHNAQCPECGYF